MGLQLNGNAPYLTLNGVNVATYLTEVKMSRSTAAEDVSHGAATFVQRQGGLSDVSFTFTLSYDISNVPAIIAAAKSGQSYVADYGPEGNGSGKPRHTQSIYIDKCDGPNISVKKSLATFAIAASSADAPTNDLYAGATF